MSCYRASCAPDEDCRGGRERRLTLATLILGSNEYFSGFDNIGHNAAASLIFLWIIPKCVSLVHRSRHLWPRLVLIKIVSGAWLIGSTYMIYTIGTEILDGLEVASHAKKQ